MGVQAALNSLAALRLTPDLHLSSLQTFISIPMLAPSCLW